MFEEFYEKINDDKKKKEDFESFLYLLKEYNGKFNLTAIKEDKEIYVKHFYDSLWAKDYLFNGAKVMEIGSGGGFPSVPLKIDNRSLKFTLCESVGKKCGFLNVVKEKLEFKDFEILNGRCEDFAKDFKYREKYDFCIARAVAQLNTLCEYMLPFLKKGGKMIAYKSQSDEETENAKNALKILGGKIEKTVDYELVDNFGKRRLIIIEKTGDTPSKYPRGKNKERSNPL
ncbi:MAG: 16S rRNA (guanine(527)-N(7))-methyltransferase RsmG [Christensenellaceae bacterium]